MNLSRFQLAAIASLIILIFPGVIHAAAEDTYYWSSYERDLFLAYDQHAKMGNFEATLIRIIKNSEETGRKPPPGVLAEYGYILFGHGEFEFAIDYFERESREWPESAVLMNRIIKRAQDEAGS